MWTLAAESWSRSAGVQMIKIKCKGKRGYIKIDGPKIDCENEVVDMIKRIVTDEPLLIYAIFEGLHRCCDKKQLHEFVDYTAKDCEFIYPDFMGVGND